MSSRTGEADLGLRLPSPLEEIHDECLQQHGVRLLLKRDDLISDELPGNKWRKLKYNLDESSRAGHRQLLTFGGAYSNHIRATAAAGGLLGFDTIGVIRGEEHLPLNPVLAFAVDHGMHLTYIDRSTYRRKTDPDVAARLHAEFGDFFLLPEGGSNPAAVRGCAEVPGEIGDDFDVICCPCGTGGTLAGIAAGLQSGQRATGFAALKGAAFLNADVAALQQATYGRRVGEWRIDLDHHFGGYAKRNAELNEFIAGFRERHGLLLDWVYVAKMMYGIYDQVAGGQISAGSTVVAVITGRAA
jgi:1-aminocyclopropane-1-carboxylate deaminase